MLSSSPEDFSDAAQESPSSPSPSVAAVLLLPGGRDVGVLLRRLLDVVRVGDLPLLHQLHGLVDVLLQLLAGVLVLLLELAELALIRERTVFHEFSAHQFPNSPYIRRRGESLKVFNNNVKILKFPSFHNFVSRIQYKIGI